MAKVWVEMEEEEYKILRKLFTVGKRVQKYKPDESEESLRKKFLESLD